MTFLVRSEGWRSSQPLMPSWGSTRSSKPRPTRGCHVIAQRYAVDPNAACSGFENGSGKVGRLRMVQRGSSGLGAPPSARSAPYVATASNAAQEVTAGTPTTVDCGCHRWREQSQRPGPDAATSNFEGGSVSLKSGWPCGK